jgi:ERCC4-type nuclease
MLQIQGKEFVDDRTGDAYEVKYADEEVTLLRGLNGHTVTTREQFERAVEAGRWDYDGVVPEEDEKSENGSDDSQEVLYEDISWVGETGAESLREMGIETVEDVKRASDSQILSARAIGEKGLENIREWVEE